ncbi:hypothetical protein L9F63_001681, partial [Diploptera punctata]
VIKMLVIVVALFALCWLPLQTYNVLQDIYPQINQYKYINIIWFCCDWLAMSNSCYNPFIYGIYNEKFKREFKQRFPFRSRGWYSSTQTTDSADFDKSQTSQTRASVRLSSYYGSNSTSNTFYRGVSVRGPIRRHNNTDNGDVTTELYVSPGETRKGGYQNKISARKSKLEHVTNKEIRNIIETEENIIERIEEKELKWLGH